MMHTAVWLSTLHLFFSAPVSHAEEDNELVVEANTRKPMQKAAA